MGSPWDEIAVGIIIAAALGYLARRGWLTLHARGGCGACRSCEVPPASVDGKALVTLDAPRAK